jgi:hypothetical protein
MEGRRRSRGPAQQQLTLGRKADRGTLTAAERGEYEALIREADRRAARAARATWEPARAAALGAEAEAQLGGAAE